MNELDEDLVDRLQAAWDASPYRPATPGSSLARARCAAHAAFDPLWQSGEMSRTQAYRWLARQLGVDPRACHMLLFDEETCGRVVRLCTERDFEVLDDA